MSGVALSGAMRLVAVRGYASDLEWGLTPDARSLGFSPETARRKAEENRELRQRAGVPWRLQGEEMVLSCDADEENGRNRLVLVNQVTAFHFCTERACWIESRPARGRISSRRSPKAGAERSPLS